MQRLQPYNLKITYVSRKYLYVADTLSRPYLPGTSTAGIDNNLVQVVHSFITNLLVTTVVDIGRGERGSRLRPPLFGVVEGPPLLKMACVVLGYFVAF